MINTKLIAFAKTPGLSPVKTRLAKTKGIVFAESLYHHCLECMAEVLRETQITNSGVEATWILAEKEAETDPFWKGSELALGTPLLQSEGELGSRLSNAFQNAITRHSVVGFLGTDLPQLSRSVLESALNKIKTSADFVIGPSRDGGFYLLFARKMIPSHIWTSIEYSSEHTCSELIAKLSKLGRVEQTEVLTDIDNEEDLVFAEAELQDLKASQGLLPAQERLLQFLRAKS